MHVAPLPLDEADRLQRLRLLGLFDHEPIAALDRLTRLLTRHFDLPIALVSLADSERQWFLSHAGTSLCEIPRSLSFCGHAMLHPDIMQVEDARLDARFADNPLVTGAPHVVFYAGRPLHASDGTVLGTLCLVDHLPRRLDAQQCQDLDDFGHLVENTLHDMERRIQLDCLSRELDDKTNLFARIFTHSAVGMALTALDGSWLRVNPGLQQLLGYSETELLTRTWQSMTHPDDLPLEAPLFHSLLAGERGHYRLEKRLRRADGGYCWVQLSVALCQGGSEPPYLAAVFADLSERKQIEAELRTLQGELEQQVTARTRDLTDTISRLEEERIQREAMQTHLWQQQRRLEHMLRHTSNAFLEIDDQERLTGWNPAASRLFGYTQEQAIGQPLRALLGDDSPLADLLCSPLTEPQRLESHITTRHHERLCVEVVAERHDFGGAARRIAFLHDISERVQANEELARSRARLREITDNLPVLISMITPDERYLFVNRAYYDYYRIEPDRILGMHVRDVLGEEAYAESAPLIANARSGKRAVLERRVTRYGEPRIIRVEFIPAGGTEPGTYVLATDITEYRLLQHQLEHEATHDPLTGLPNRRAFTLRLTRELERVQRGETALGLLFIDLDGFKQINDHFGHDMGDLMLRHVAQLLGEAVRGGDMVARLAGDEFTVLLPGLELQELGLSQLSQRLLEAMAKPLQCGKQTLQTAGSIGGVLCRPGKEYDLDHLLHQADEAMYRAKAAGKGRYQWLKEE